MVVTGLSGESYEVDAEPFYAAGSRAVQYLCRDQRGQQRLYKVYRTPVTDPNGIEWMRQAVLSGRQTVLGAEAAGGGTGNAAEAVNWPIDLVLHDGAPPAVVLPLIPREYLQPDGRPRTLDQLWSGAGGQAANLRTALAIRLCDVARAIEERGFVHGDLSPKNVLFQESAPLVYVIDTAGLTPVDAAYDRFKDRYDLAVLLNRILFLDAGTPAELDPRLRALFDRAFGNGGFGPEARPSASEWGDALRATSPGSVPAMPTVALTAPQGSPTGWSNPQQPIAYSPPPQSNSTNTALKVILGALVGVLIIVIGIAVVVLNGNSSTNTASPTSTTTAPPTTTTTAPPTTTSARFDPNTLNQQATDKTPFTSDALLPSSFTDSKNVVFTRTSYGATDVCTTNNMSQNVKTALQKNNCQRLMTGTYLDAAQTIQVSVEIFTFPSSTESDAVYSSLNGQNQLWDIWCPTDGVGSDVCKANKDTWLAAAYSSWGRQQYRYLYESFALYLNLTQDTSLEPNLEAPAHTVINVVGPDNYWKNR